MGVKKKVASKVVKKITKNANVEKILESTIDTVANNIEKNKERKIKQEEQEKQEERELEIKKEKSIKNIKNYKVNNSDDIINFFREAKMNIKDENIESDEKNIWFLKIDEVYEKAQESITDQAELEKITKKYKELKEIRKNGRFG